jgi:2-polyprenyl-3-methyl-5-hydroxy-6-metoxy-1,4-benzoquinol methylase
MSNHSTSIKSEIGYFKNNRSEMLKYIPENAINILEVGCGEGNFISLLKSDKRELWGIEINDEAAQKATEVCTFVLTGDFNTVYEQLPVNHFDCIVFNDVLEHMYLPWDVLAMSKKLLRSGGVIVSSIPNFRYISNLITEIVLEGEFRYKPNGGILDDTHIRFFTSKSILRMYNDLGYKVLKHEGLHPCRSWKEKLFIFLSFGILKDSRYKQFATTVKPA